MITIIKFDLHKKEVFSQSTATYFRKKSKILIAL